MNSPCEILHSAGINLDRKIELTNVQWQTQESNFQSILFYRFNQANSAEIDNFEKRMSCCNYGVCITNVKKVESAKKAIFAVDEKYFLDLQINLLNSLYPVSFEKIKLLGVTGTNGKTTTVDLVRQLLVQQKRSVLTIGTLGVYFNNDFVKTFSLTTPSYIDLHKLIAEYADKVDVVAMEMSSHALEQKRFGRLYFDAIGWTSFTQDHLDYHGNMENYFEAKLKCLHHLHDGNKIRVPVSQESLVKKLGDYAEAVSFSIPTTNLFLKPQYNQENMAIALSLVADLIDFSEINLSKINPPPGRFNILSFKDNYIVIDFAHTPDALLSIGKELQETFPGHSIVTVFGCGGDRDRSKRPLMGQAVSQFSQFVYLTSDNPRFEDPQQIVNDVIPGITVTYEVILDRRIAIKKSIENLKSNVLLIAGKGHESYIDQNGIKTNYSDLEEVEKYIHD